MINRDLTVGEGVDPQLMGPEMRSMVRVVSVVLRHKQKGMDHLMEESLYEVLTGSRGVKM